MRIPIVLKALQDVRFRMHEGKSVLTSLEETVEESKDPYFLSLKSWLIRISSGQRSETIFKILPELVKTPARKALIDVLEKGLQGTPIDPFLKELEEEIFHIAEVNYTRQLQVLPLKLMVPLVLFVLPGVILLILGPLLFTVERAF